MKDSFFYQNRNCAYYPCHEGADSGNFNCFHCYCPLYALGEKCGGGFRYTEKGIKDCSACLLPHLPGGNEYIVNKLPLLAELVRKKTDSTLV